MHVLKAKNKQELLAEVSRLENNIEFYINLRPTAEILKALTEKCPASRRITCPPSFFRQASRELFELVRQKGLEFQPGNFKVGRPKKYKADEIRKIFAQKSMGKPAKLIAEEMEMPLRTVYFYLKNGFEE